MLIALKKRSLLLTLLIMVTACSGDGLFSKKEPLPTGERISIIGTENKLVSDATLQKTPINIPQALNVEAWDHTINSRVQNIQLNKPLEKSNTFKVSSAAEFSTTTTPVITGNLLFAMGSSGEIIAFDYKNDDKLWENNYFSDAESSSFFSSLFINGGLSDYNGIIYATAGLNKVIALDSKDGKVIWSTSVSSPTRGIVSKNNDKVFIQTIDNKLFCLNAANGKIVWNQFSTTEDMYVLNIPSVSSTDSTIIVQYASGEVSAIKSDHGDEIWSIMIGKSIDSVQLSSYTHSIYITPIIDNNVVYVNGKEGVVAALELSSGKILWNRELNISRQFWLAGDYIYAITDDNKLLAIHKNDGLIRWVTDLSTFNKAKQETPTQWSEPVMANSQIITASSEGKIFSFDPNDGKLADEISVDKTGYQRPIIIKGNLFLTSDEGTIALYTSNK